SLRNRAQGLGTETVEEADEVGRRTVLDLDDETAEGHDVVFGSRVEAEEEADDDGDDAAGREHARLNRLAREVEALAGKGDEKLRKAVGIVRRLVDGGYAPILFCRFIPTVEYVAAELRKRLGAEVAVEAVTGLLPAEEREHRVERIGGHKRRVLVTTDCLSEGINLQEHFNAVVHYDLSWNPTRHEQREGRVDRYGQNRPMVRTLTFYGDNSPIDGIVLKVLLRKHEEIRRKLGISVPVPMETDSVQEAIFESLLLREDAGVPAEQMAFDFLEQQQQSFDVEWQTAAEREKKSRTIFAQHQIRVDEVDREVRAVRGALGDAGAVERFMGEALAVLGAVVVPRKNHLEIDLAEAPHELRDALSDGGGAVKTRVRAAFGPPAPAGGEVLTRTHPLVAAVANRIWNEALDPEARGAAR
ncbi:MAG: SWF/SNF helicase family protein, partial [bacterium]|nr:SWF/SNF helicase family protein [bacterium]